MRAYASLHGRRKAGEDLGVSRHTLWRFLERGHTGRAVHSVNTRAGETRSGTPAQRKFSPVPGFVPENRS